MYSNFGVLLSKKIFKPTSCLVFSEQTLKIKRNLLVSSFILITSSFVGISTTKGVSLLGITFDATPSQIYTLLSVFVLYNLIAFILSFVNELNEWRMNKLDNESDFKKLLDNYKDASKRLSYDLRGITLGATMRKDLLSYEDIEDRIKNSDDLIFGINNTFNKFKMYENLRVYGFEILIPLLASLTSLLYQLYI
jgi:hypothetical protein